MNWLEFIQVYNLSINYNYLLFLARDNSFTIVKLLSPAAKYVVIIAGNPYMMNIIDKIFSKLI